jgi:peptide/nickel transport system ATP-binding protein
MRNPLLEIKNLHVYYRVFEGILKVLNGIDLIVYPGERVGVVGEMGCGKTTTMKSIMGILPRPAAIIHKGEILFQGNDILKMGKTEIEKIRRKNISMIFEDPTAALNPVFTIGTQIIDVIKFSKQFNEKKNKKILNADAIQVLREVMLPDPDRVLQNYPFQLSGGMRQRVCIAMALVSTNNMIIADEPGTSLDVTIKDQIFRLLKELVVKRSTAIILVSQALGEVKGMTDRLYIMYAGSIIETSDTNELFSKPLHPYTKGLLAATPRLTGGGIGEGIEGSIADYLNPPIGCRFYPRCKYSKPICKKEKPPFFKVSEGHTVACFLFKDKVMKGDINEK